MTTLDEYGWDDFFAGPLAALGAPELRPGRVILLQRGLYRLATAAGAVDAVVPGRLRHGTDGGPAIGDWVAFRSAPGAPAVIAAVLPRRTRVSRASAGRRTREQVVAANVDTVLVVMGLDADYNLRRLERYLSMVRESGAAPLVVLNKADLVLPEELPRLLLGAQEMATGAPVAAVAAHTGEGLEELAPFLQPGRTIALVGSSGAGKSTLINRLLGEERLATGQVREHDRRGQHTTTHRELVVLPTGALLIDNPGLRELQLWDAADGLAETFEDVEARAARCRFRDCRHQAEPGCAVRAAVEEGDLDPDRLRNYHALTRELENLELRRDGGAQRLEKRRWKAIHSEMKRLRKHSPKP